MIQVDEDVQRNVSDVALPSTDTVVSAPSGVIIVSDASAAMVSVPTALN